jgi:hypothetical protein
MEVDAELMIPRWSVARGRVYMLIYSVECSLLPQAGGLIYRGIFKACLDKQGEVYLEIRQLEAV